ncbi:uncharacterized protein DNG_03157 [Cephalotrichum gorgonifer]|uniref:F-box domain-containing protein n=1 Tax=Cephalotrichum gorgonifer TaxID=2041049 RepID=A0AAE8MUC0_9PEZI|nr:uncharacterized protein DNG_03157 [Cephalotrichum gorgonifer]
MGSPCFPEGQQALDQSESNQLPTIEPTPRPPVEKGIFCLPDELLLGIITLATVSAANSQYGSTDNRLAERGRLCFVHCIVCRRFNRLVTPLLYGSLKLSVATQADRYERSLTTFRNLHRTLIENPSLGKHTFTLIIDFSFVRTKGQADHDAILAMFADFATLFPNTTSLTVAFPRRVDFHLPNYGIKRRLKIFRAAACHMTKLQKLSLKSDVGLPSLKHICQALSPLQYLQYFSCWVESGSLVQSDILHSSSITTLDLQSFTGSAKDLQVLLTWPKYLKSLKLSLSIYQNPPPLIGLSTVSSGLSLYKNTLRSLDIGGLLVQGHEGFDLTEFDNLESLTLSSCSMGIDCGNGENLLAPRLLRFNWKFPRRARVDGYVYEFTRLHENWLRRFACAATRTGSSLNRIHIGISGIEYSWGVGNWPEVYPWDCIDRVASEVKGAGIEILYHKPRMTRSDFYKQRDEETGSP